MQLPFVDEKLGQSECQLLRHQAAAKSNRRLQAPPVGQLHLSERWRTCSHSSSCPRLDQEEMPWFHWKKTNGYQIRQISVHWIIMTADINH